MGWDFIYGAREITFFVILRKNSKHNKLGKLIKFIN